MDRWGNPFLLAELESWYGIRHTTMPFTVDKGNVITHLVEKHYGNALLFDHLSSDAWRDNLENKVGVALYCISERRDGETT